MKKNYSKHAFRHGMIYSRSYKSWAKMKERCQNPHTRSWPDYGGRGISVCDEWSNDFRSFFRDMGNPPSNHSLGRIDNSLGYFKDNCRWETSIQQGRNKRNNVLITFGGHTKTMTDWSRSLGVLVGTIWKRIQLGWSDEDIISTPVRQFKHNK